MTTVKKAPAKKKPAATKKQGRLSKLFSNIKSYLNRVNSRIAAAVLVDVALIVIAGHLIVSYIN